MNITSPQFQTLPLELQCEIISYITDYDDIANLYYSSSYLHPLLERCIQQLMSSNGQEDFSIIGSLLNLKQINYELDIKKVSQILLVANLPYLQHAEFDIIKLENIGFSSSTLVSLFIEQYCNGEYVSCVNGIRTIKQHNRTLLKKYFYFDASPDSIIIRDGILYSSYNNYQLIIKMMAKYSSLKGLRVIEKLSQAVLSIIDKAPEFSTVIIDPESQNYLDVLESIKYLLDRNKIEILDDDEYKYDEIYVDNSDNFIQSLPNYIDNRLRVWGLAISISNLSLVVNKFSSIDTIAVYLPLLDPEVLPVLYNFFNKNKQINTIIIRYTDFYNISKEEFVSELKHNTRLTIIIK